MRAPPAAVGFSERPSGELAETGRQAPANPTWFSSVSAHGRVLAASGKPHFQGGGATMIHENAIFR